MANAQSRDGALDGLRAFAVVLVLLRHIIGNHVPGGFVGVDIFFVLSGYLISSILTAEFGDRGSVSLRRFYVRRCARLMPGLALYLLAVIASMPLIGAKYATPAQILFAATYTTNWARALGAGDSFVLGHTWSLGIEEQFYLLWPPVLIFALRWPRRAAAPLAAVGLALVSTGIGIALHIDHAPWERIYNGFDTRAVQLLAGCAIAFVPLGGSVSALLGRLWFLPVAVVLASALTMRESSTLLPLGGYAVLAMTAAWAVIAIRVGSPIVGALAHPVPAYLGRISYGVYLWHPLILAVCDWADITNPLLKLAIIIPVTVGVAALSFRFVEAPILRAAGDRLAGTLGDAGRIALQHPDGASG